MTIFSTEQLFNELKKIIDLPNEVIDLQINISVDSFPTIKITKYATHDNGNNGIYPSTEHAKFVLIRPWEAKNDHGEYPNGLCCQRATGEFCYEHDENNYKVVK